MPAAPQQAPRRAPAASADIWSLGGATSAPSADPGYDPSPRQSPRLDDFGSQHISMPASAPSGQGAASPFGTGAQPAVPPRMPASEPFSAPRPAAQPQPTRPNPPRKPQAARHGASADAMLLRAICEGAGIRPEALMAGDPAETGREIGRALRIVAEDLANLLKARAATKQSVKSRSRTMIGNTDNNPLKFVPTAEEALEVMFGTARPGFQRGAAAVKSALDDIKRHQYGVHAAIQPALAQLLEELAPEAIEGKIGGSVLTSKKTKAWELYVERWDAMTAPYDNGMLDVFLAYFSDAYDAATRKS